MIYFSLFPSPKPLQIFLHFITFKFLLHADPSQNLWLLLSRIKASLHRIGRMLRFMNNGNIK
jgi:hypothetical protein